MKKVCLICTISEPCRLFLAPMAQYFHKHTDWDISLMCSTLEPGDADMVPEGVRYFCVPMERGLSLKGFSACRKMMKIFRQEKFDMIQYCSPNASMYAALAGWLTGIKVRLYCQWGLFFVSFPKGFKRWLFQNVEKTVCRLSTHVQPDSFGNLKLCHDLKLYPKSKGSVVWNGSTCGLDLQKFDITKKQQWRREIRQEYDIAEDVTVFGFVGRITRDKGINELLGAFRSLTQNHEKVCLMMLGIPDKPEKLDRELYAWAQESPHVKMCGFHNDVQRFFAAMDCYILPSYREGFGTSVIEAEAMEVPVIATNIPGPTEGMQENVTGILVEPRSTEALLAALERFMADPAAMESLGKAGRTYVEERFELNRFLQATLEDRMGLLEKNL